MTYIEALASGLCVFGRRDEVLNDLVFEDKTGYYLMMRMNWLKSLICFFLNQKNKENDGE